MEPLFFSTGYVARELGITQARVRDLCRNGAIKAETTDGGQFRIPREVLDMLRREGVPALPKPMPNAGQVVTVIPAAARRGHPALLAAPSDDVIDSAEEVVCLENEVKSLGLRRQKEEQLDWFREREDQDAERVTQRQEAEQRRQAQAAAERRSQAWRTEWLEYGLDKVPCEAPQSVRLDVHEAVVQALARIDPSYPDSTTLRLVDAAVDRALTPWRTAEQIADAIKDACESYDVPWDMRHDSAWKARMYQAAGTAVARLRNGASLDEVNMAASQAVVPLVQEFELRNASAEMVNDVWMKLSGATSEEHELGKDAVRAALEKLPIGSSKREMERARDNALDPIRRAIAARQDGAMRVDLLQWVGLRYRFRQLSLDSQQKALNEISGAFNQLPVGTARASLDVAVNSAIDRYYGIHEQEEHNKKEAAQREADQQRKRRAAEFKASLHLNYIETFLQEEYEFDGGYSEVRREADRLREPVRQTLVEKLMEDPDMDADEIRAAIEERVDGGL